MYVHYSICQTPKQLTFFVIFYITGVGECSVRNLAQGHF